MKAYTDLEQSKKLVEILPIESADMFHFIHEVDTVGFGYKKDAAEHYSKTEFEYLPCWSLAALLSVLPKSLIYTPNPSLDGYCCKNIMHDLETYEENPVDACVAMIERLHELKML